jgi:hypothetical protein
MRLRKFFEDAYLSKPELWFSDFASILVFIRPYNITASKMLEP